MSVLCVVAHPDDEVLGVGGTLARHAADGDDVHICILSDGVTSRYDETDAADAEIQQRRRRAEQAADTLGATVSLHGFPDNSFDTVPLLDIVQVIEREVADHDPEVVYTHHYGDLNIDHELASRAVATAARPLPDATFDEVLLFPTLSSSEWSLPKSDNAFQATTYVNIEDYVDAKVEAMKIYQTELREHPHPRSTENIRRAAHLWGSNAGVPAAEPFELLRSIRE